MPRSCVGCGVRLIPEPDIKAMDLRPSVVHQSSERNCQVRHRLRPWQVTLHRKVEVPRKLLYTLLCNNLPPKLFGVAP